MKHGVLVLITLLLSYDCSFAATKRALFLGNSYTYVNNLPQMVADAAASAGDTLIFNSNTPGGQNLGGHLGDPVSVNLIKGGGYDFVILQEQSMRPSQPDDWVESDFLLNARRLDSLINKYNPCGETMFYMTWGYRDGNQGFCDSYPWWPYECTYEVMDSLTRLRYCLAASRNHAVVSPVGAVWHYIRHHYPSVELYESDGSHPSLIGSYAAACCFYTSVFRKSPALISYSANLDAATVALVHEAVSAIVYDSLLTWHIGEYDGSVQVGCPGSPHGTTQLNFLPNPSSNSTALQLPENLSAAALEVYSLSGSLVIRAENVNGPFLWIDTSKLPAGIYQVQLQQQDELLGRGRMVVIHE